MLQVLADWCFYAQQQARKEISDPINETPDGLISTVIYMSHTCHQATYFNSANTLNPEKNPTAHAQTRTVRRSTSSRRLCAQSWSAETSERELVKNGRADGSASASMNYSPASSRIAVPSLQTYLPPRTPSSARREAL